MKNFRDGVKDRLIRWVVNTGETEDYEHGIIVITTGAVGMKPDSYLYGDGNTAGT